MCGTLRMSNDVDFPRLSIYTLHILGGTIRNFDDASYHFLNTNPIQVNHRRNGMSKQFCKSV